MPSTSSTTKPKGKGKDNPKDESEAKEIIREIHKGNAIQGRTFQIENKQAKIILATNFDSDEFPKLATIGVWLLDRLQGDNTDFKDYV